MATLLIALAGIATIACPIALVWVWVLRVSRTGSKKNLRLLCGWSSLVLVSFAVAVYWVSAFHSPQPGTPAWDVYFGRWSRVSIATSVLGLLTGVFGSGRKQGVVLAASVIVPLSWALAKILE